MSTALVLRGVRKKYGRNVALDGLDLEVPAGSLFGLVGPNGAGKTTSFGIVGGAVRADAGTIDVLGKGPFNPAIHAGRVTLLPQDCELSPHSSAEQLLGFHAELQGLPRRAARADAARVLELVRLSDRARSRVRELSHGMRRRLAVAQALLGEPELVLLDEPTGGLDPHLVVEMREILRSQRGLRTIIVSSHLLADLEAVCDHVAFLERGRSVRAGSIESLTRRSHLVRVRLEEAIDGEEDLRGALTPWKLHFNGMEILIELDEESSAAQANERILRALFDRDARVLELRLGESLEDAYLAAREQARSP